MADPKPGSGLKTVEKAMRILESFSHARPELSVGELSQELGIHKSNVSRLVSSLCRGRLLEQDPVTRKVRVGVGAFRLGSIFASRQNVVQKLLPFLGTLTARIDQSAHAVVLDGALGLVVATVESPSALRVITRVGEHRFLHATAAGKLLLAFSPPALLEAIAVTPGLTKLTPTTITEMDALQKQLAEIRETRLSWNNGESHSGVGGVAAPVLDEGGNIVAAIAAVFPMNVAGEAEQQAFAKETLEISARISELFRSDGGKRGES
jgi:IclR family KDG regulon transcriptional repressor